MSSKLSALSEPATDKLKAELRTTLQELLARETDTAVLLSAQLLAARLGLLHVDPAVVRARFTSADQPEATPDRSVSTDDITVVVRGATVMAIPNPSTTIAGRNVLQYGPPTPGSGGEWRAGDRIWNLSPGPGKPMGWICTSPGSPGIWTPMPSL